MGFLKKINRGLILTVVILLSIAIYLVAQSGWQNKEKVKIEEVCRQYINTAVKYRQLPEKYRRDKPDISQGELENHINNMTKDLEALYAGNELTLKNVINKNKTALESQAAGKDVILSYKKDIVEFSDFIFEGKTVTVNIQTNSVLEVSNAFEQGIPGENISSQTADTITLRNAGREWKIFYADLQLPSKNNPISKPEVNYYE